MPSPRRAVVDEVTLRRALGGDREALAVLWRTHNSDLVRFLRSIGTSDADDVASEVWVEMMRRAPEVRSPAQLLTVLFTIARRRSIDRHRSRARRPEVLAVITESTTATDGSTETRVDVVELLRRLDPAVAEVVYLRAALDLPAAVVGEITGRSEVAVRVMAMRGLRTLRSLSGDLSKDLEKSPVTADETPAMVQT